MISSAPLSRVAVPVASASHLVNKFNILEPAPSSAANIPALSEDEVDLSVLEDAETKEAEQSAGAWTLIPKDHMLVCKGEDNSVSVMSISLQPIQITNTFACPKTVALFRKRTKEKLLICKAAGLSGGTHLTTKQRSKL